MKPAPFDYHRPGSLPEALATLAGEPNAKVLAGGQSLVPLLSMRLAAPATLVDINAVPDLAAITVEEHEGRPGVRIGALARHADVLASPDVRRVQPLVTEALAHVAHATIRNRGTTVGSIVHADAAAEMPAVLLLLGGSVEAASVRGTRTIPADELFVGPLESALAADEIATSAFFPALPAGAGVAFDEIARRHGDYALCGVAAARRRRVGARRRTSRWPTCPTVVDLSGVPLAETGEAAPGPARAGRRHPRQRGLPCASWCGCSPSASSARPPRTPRRPRPATDRRRRMSETLHDVRLVVNGVAHDVRVPARRLLSDALRHDLGLTGTHVGCEHGVCGACTILVDGARRGPA